MPLREVNISFTGVSDASALPPSLAPTSAVSVAGGIAHVSVAGGMAPLMMGVVGSDGRVTLLPNNMVRPHHIVGPHHVPVHLPTSTTNIRPKPTNAVRPLVFQNPAATTTTTLTSSQTHTAHTLHISQRTHSIKTSHVSQRLSPASALGRGLRSVDLTGNATSKQMSWVDKAMDKQNCLGLSPVAVLRGNSDNAKVNSNSNISNYNNSDVLACHETLVDTPTLIPRPLSKNTSDSSIENILSDVKVKEEELDETTTTTATTAIKTTTANATDVDVAVKSEPIDLEAPSNHVQSTLCIVSPDIASLETNKPQGSKTSMVS